ncbi:MAG: 4Fe-4S binding protein [Mariprofundus sp.]|nr:4Fe-4S binding protein [Mariprofundus sp.]
MNARELLSQIPVRQEHVPGAQRVHGLRRMSQYIVMGLLVVIPVSGLFRIDPMAGAFRLLDYQVWFSDISIVMGFWMMAATGLIFMYSWAGAVFCGWVCPQNTLSEWANALTSKLLGRRALMMDVSGQKMQVARRKNVWLNKVVLAASFVLVAMLFAIIPLLYFFDPAVIWSFIILHPVAKAEHLLWIYTVCVLIVLVDVAAMRHLVCKYMCIYRVWQHSFKTRDTLHIAYDASRSDDCLNCNYCEDSCFLDIDPRRTEVFDSCINCGECVAACDQLHHKSKKMQGPGLLSFAFGAAEKGAAEKSAAEKGQSNLGSLLSRTKAASVGTLIGAVFFILGVMSYQPYSMVVDRAELMAGTTALDYRINLANKRYQAAQVHLRIEGLPASMYRLEQDEVSWMTVGRKDVMLHFSPDLKKGLHRLTVLAESDDGWTDSFKVTYYAEGA